jgi:hypothetical protein
MTVDNQQIRLNATIRQEYVKCGDPDCTNSHGQYLYAYWKQDKKLKERYVGKNPEDFGLRKIAKEIKVKPSQLIKLKFIQQETSKDNVLAKQCLEKLRKEEVSIDWAHRVIVTDTIGKVTCRRSLIQPIQYSCFHPRKRKFLMVG